MMATMASSLTSEIPAFIRDSCCRLDSVLRVTDLKGMKENLSLL